MIVNEYKNQIKNLKKSNIFSKIAKFLSFLRRNFPLFVNAYYIPFSLFLICIWIIRGMEFDYFISRKVFLILFLLW